MLLLEDDDHLREIIAGARLMSINILGESADPAGLPNFSLDMQRESTIDSGGVRNDGRWSASKKGRSH